MIATIDAMVSDGDIREYQERYSPSLLALTVLIDQDAQDFLRDCSSVLAALRVRYLENYADLVAIECLAANANMECDRFRRSLAFLNENVAVVAGSQGRYGDPDYKVIPSEKVLTLRTIADAVNELRQYQTAFGGRSYVLRSSPELAPAASESSTPPVRPWVDELSLDLKALMNEIFFAQHAGLRALPVMGVRAAIDTACNDLVGDSGGFDAKLKELARLGHISDAQRETLVAVVQVGHASAHRGHTPNATDVDSTVDILERLLKSLYLDPETARRLKMNTPSRTRKDSL